MIKIFNIIVIVFLLLLSPVASDRVAEIYFLSIIGSKVVPLTMNGRRYCSASNIEHKGKVYLVTNMHCCKRRKGFATFLETDFKQKHRVLSISKTHDICIAEPTPNSSHGLHISTEYIVGDSVRLIGFPRGMSKTLRKGTIVEITLGVFPWIRNNLFHKYLHITATTYPGNSGSPVVDRVGRVIGILFAGDVRYVTEGLVVPSEYIIEAIEQI